ncbi:MAG: pantoate--beta-alanine ligase [Microbacteriaceae bacterium]|nr:pantoate--beta-alanine ligase [Microbacteriaceae bacterium]
MPSAPVVLETIAAVRGAVAAARAAGRTIALVPTMGALHDGHLAHVTRVRAADPGAFVVVSVFVNPLQFGAGEDFERYPRTLDDDAAKLATVGADAIFAPSVAEMYPDGGALVRVSAGAVGGTFEGAARPGHFDGALTVVAKLLHIVGPDVATFGRKDAQQLWLVSRMVRDLDFPVRIEEIEIVREPDGLAMSSRNRYLSTTERAAALALSRSLAAAEAQAGAGAGAVLAATQAVLAAEPGVEPGYVAVVDASTFTPAPEGFRGPVIALVAARVGATRLIDNARFRLG